MRRERFIISFSPGFNRVISGCLISQNRFNGFPPIGESETVETVPKSKGELDHPVETG
jgi:hypothetical protein